MQLYVRAVDWQKVVDVVEEGKLAEVMESDQADTLALPGYRWNDYSSVHYMHAAEALAAISQRLPEDMQPALEAMARLINEEMAFPRDLDGVGRDVIAGAVDPEHVEALLEALEDINYDAIATAFDTFLPARLKTSLTRGFDRKAMTNYLQLWYDLLEFAHDRQGGVLIEARVSSLLGEPV